jgi:glycerate kinase
VTAAARDVADPFRVLCAPDKFKGTLSAVEAAEAMARGARLAGANVTAELCPVADGGEGTLDALVAAMGARIEPATVTGPLWEPVEARYGVAADGRTAIVELADASGLALVPRERRDPARTTTYGAGQLIRLAAARGSTTVIVGVGGSATCDGGLGLAQALGAQVYDREGRRIDRPITGGMLHEVSRVEPPPALPAIRVACDVTNPLFGPRGAARIYAPQKGANPVQVALLDAGLAHLAALIGGDPAAPGAGAAGGAGFGLAALCGGRLERGADLVLDALGFAERCQGASLVLTGEGRLDHQTIDGKAVAGVAAAAHRAGIPAIAIVGSTGPGADACTDPTQGGFLRRFISLSARFGEGRAMRETTALIGAVARLVVEEAVVGR